MTTRRKIAFHAVTFVLWALAWAAGVIIGNTLWPHDWWDIVVTASWYSLLVPAAKASDLRIKRAGQDR